MVDEVIKSDALDAEPVVVEDIDTITDRAHKLLSDYKQSSVNSRLVTNMVSRVEELQDLGMDVSMSVTLLDGRPGRGNIICPVPVSSISGILDELTSSSSIDLDAAKSTIDNVLRGVVSV